MSTRPVDDSERTTPLTNGARSARVRAAGAPLGPGSILWATAGDPRGLLPGTAAGTTTRNSAPIGPHPSTFAASSRSRGIESK